MEMSILRNISKRIKKHVQPALSHYFCTSVVLNAESEIEEMSNTQNKNRIVWIDMEMTGLDVEKDRILEVACLITDENLNVVSNEFNMVLNQPDRLLKGMDEWCQDHHGSSGLIEESRNSKATEDTVEKDLLYFMMQYIPKGKCPMAGNSVYMDRLFLRKYMPIANDYMHYRIIDVSSIKEVVKRWKPEIYKEVPDKKLNHRALSDIRESIAELDFYRKNVFTANSNE